MPYSDFLIFKNIYFKILSNTYYFLKNDVKVIEWIYIEIKNKRKLETI